MSTSLINGVEAEFCNELVELFSLESSIDEVVLYGSRAKGNFRAGSDIDLTIKGAGLTTNWLMELSVKIDDLLMPYLVDLSIFDHIENEDLVEHIKRVGKVVYKR